MMLWAYLAHRTVVTSCRTRSHLHRNHNCSLVQDLPTVPVIRFGRLPLMTSLFSSQVVSARPDIRGTHIHPILGSFQDRCRRICLHRSGLLLILTRAKTLKIILSVHFQPLPSHPSHTLWSQEATREFRPRRQPLSYSQTKNMAYPMRLDILHR